VGKTRRIITLLTIIILCTSSASALFDKPPILYQKITTTTEGNTTGGFTTDQNEELNTTGNPNFNSATLNNLYLINTLYFEGGMSDASIILYGDGFGTPYELKFTTAGIEFSFSEDTRQLTTPNGYCSGAYCGSVQQFLTDTDTNTNAGTECETGEYLDGDENCYPIPSASEERNFTQSSGKFSGGIFTSLITGEINVSGGRGFFRATNNDTAEALYKEWDSDTISLTNNSINYLYVNYNSGNPIIQTSTSMPSDHNTKILLGLVYREGTELHEIHAGQYIASYDKNDFFKDIEINGKFQRVNGIMISETGTRNIAVTAGAVYAGMTKETINSFDSSATDTIKYYYYRNGTGGFTKITGQTQIDNLHYDDGSGTLATLSSGGWFGGNNYGIHWVYEDIDSELFVVYGIDSYTLKEAQEENPPSDIAELLHEVSGLIGKIIIQKNSNSFTSTQTSFTQTFSPSSVSNHNELSNLQGGATDEYNHLNNTEYEELGYFLNHTIISSNNITLNNVNSILLMEEFSGEHTERLLHWNSETGHGEMGMAGGITTSITNDVIRVTNDDSVDMIKGQLVYISGTVGASSYKVKLADKSSIYTSGAMAILMEDINMGQKGYVQTKGVFNSGLDTSECIFSGQVLWLGDNGNKTTTRPNPPDISTIVGVCGVVHATEGDMYLHFTTIPRLIGLSDVEISNPNDNDLIQWDDALSAWTTTNITAGEGITITHLNNQIMINSTSTGASGIWENVSGTATYLDNMKSGKVDSYNGLYSIGEGSVAHGYSECTIPFLCDMGGGFGVDIINSSGKGSFASGYAVGYNKRVISSSGNGCTALGSTIDGSVICSGEGSIAVGSTVTVSGDTAGGFGRRNDVSGVSAFGFGYDNDISGSYGLGFGWGNDITGGYVSLALGKQNTISGDTAGAIGSDNTVSHNGAYVLGINISTDASKSVYLGKDDNYIRVDGNNIKLNSILNTGSNAGSNLCIDANNNLCTCGNCA